MLTDTPHEISVRERPYGGRTLAAAEEHPRGRLTRRSELVLLIHGFNVDACSAGCTYDRFLGNSIRQLQDCSVLVYWPGDAVSRFLDADSRPGLWSRIVSALHYPRQRQTAVESAQLLSTIISASLSPQRVTNLTIVAHSLGCRVALELLLRLNALKQQRTLRVPLVVLMAPAVPRYAVTSGGSLHASLALADRVLLYRSLNDRVLHYVFRPGQSLETPFPEGWRPSTRTALGRNGFGLNKPRNVHEVEAECDHGGYWPDPNIAYEVGREVFGARAAFAEAAPAWRSSAPDNAGLLGRRLHVRSLQERSIRSAVRRPCGGCD